MLDQEIESLKAQLPSNTTAPSLDQQIADLSSVPEVNTTVDIETGLPTEREIAGGASTGVVSGKTLTVRDKSTNSEYQLPPNFIELVNNRTLDGMTLYPIINNTNFEFSPDVKAALENFVKMDEPFSDLIGGGKSFDERRGTARRPEDLGSSAQDVVLGIQNLAAGPIRGIGKFFGQLSGGQAGQEAIEEYLPEGISREDLALSRLLQIPGTKYVPPSVLGDTEGSAPLTTDEAIKQLQEQNPNEVISNVRKERLAAEAEAEREAKGGTDFSKYAPDLQERLDADFDMPELTIKEQADKDKGMVNQGSFFSSPDWNEFLRNLGIGLSESSDMASGLVRGTALGSQAKALREAEELEAKQAEKLARIEAGAEDEIDLKDRKTIFDVEQKMNSSLREYNNAIAAQELVDSVIGFANGTQNIATFAAKIGATVADITGAITGNIKDVTQLTDTKRAQIALDILTNRNIKEILGESGRTISNIDRDIASRIVGNLTMRKIQSVAELKQRLNDNKQSIVEKRNEAQRNIRSSVNFLNEYNPNLLREDEELFNIYSKDFSINPISGAQYETEDVDYRASFKDFNKSN